MLARTQAHRITAIFMMATLTAISLAPAAYAGNGHGRKYKRSEVSPRCVERVVYSPAPRVVVHQSSAGPVLAGLIGGFLIGNAVANANTTVHYAEYSPAPACPVAPTYYYYDPVCRMSFDNFNECRDHARYHNGAHVIQVIEVGSGNCVETYQWYGGGWRYHAGDDWNN